MQRIKIGGVFTIEVFDRHGQLKEIEKDTHNLITTEGLNYILDAAVHNGSIASFYMGLFEDNYTVLAGDTYAIPGFTESTAYSEVTRQSYVEIPASAASTTNEASKAVFSINDTKTMYGACLVGGGSAATTKADTAGGGTLLCAVKFGTAKAVESGDTLQVTYKLSAADDAV